jgi:uncharacterized protein YjiS (DUF1127 family)
MSLSESAKTIFPVAVTTRTASQKGLIERAIGLVRAWRKLARDRAQLAAMSDLTLRDIGFDKATAELEATRTFWERPSDAWQSHGHARRRAYRE